MTVRATAIDRTRSIGFTISFFDKGGKKVTCDPVVTQVGRRTLRPTVQTFHKLPHFEHRVRVVNGRPGLRSLTISVNGTLFRLTNMHAGETRRFSVRRAMRPGFTNTITLVGRGAMGGTAMVMIADVP